MEYKFSDAVLINPKESLKKGAIAKKIAMADIQENYRFIKNFELNKFKGGTKFRNGDTLFARITPCLENGKIAQVNILEENEVAFGSTEFLVLRDKEGVTIPDYVYYLSKWDYIKNNAIKSMTGTSGRQRVQNSIFDELVVDIPSIETQKRIVSVLNNLDYKIEINNKIIENLEDQAQAIFKSWFVDFEPFQDGNFVESELGLIPEGWKVFKLEDIADISNGYSFKSRDLQDSYKNENDYRVFKQGDIKVGGGFNPDKTKSWISEKFIENNKIERFILDKNDILMCMTDMKDNVRLLGNTAYIWEENKYVLNQRVGRIRCANKKITPSFIYFLTNSQEFLNDLRGRANRGVQVNLSSKEIKRSLFVMPNEQYLNRFNKYSTLVMEMVGNLYLENYRLIKLRDTLLPKLMSGEIDVSNIKIDDEDIDYEWDIPRRWIWKIIYRIYRRLRLHIYTPPRACKG